MCDEQRDYAEVIRSQGAEFLGILLGPHGALVLFSDPTSWTTLAVYELEFSAQTVSQRLQKVGRRSPSCRTFKNHSAEDAL
jgi:hypothetical protein